MSSFSNLTRFAQVRYGYTECDTYRDALGGAEPLRCFVTDGPLDAPGWMPAGSTEAPSKLPGDKPRASIANRPGNY
jgi:hypothetical protein